LLFPRGLLGLESVTGTRLGLGDGLSVPHRVFGVQALAELGGEGFAQGEDMTAAGQVMEMADSLMAGLTR